MPITHAAAKSLRQSRKRQRRNRQINNALKQTVKKALRAIEAKRVDDAKSAVATAVQALDKARQKGVLKRNTAARKKSRLVLALNRLAKAGSA